jgi:hypothetical protein
MLTWLFTSTVPRAKKSSTDRRNHTATAWGAEATKTGFNVQPPPSNSKYLHGKGLILFKEYQTFNLVRPRFPFSMLTWLFTSTVPRAKKSSTDRRNHTATAWGAEATKTGFNVQPPPSNSKYLHGKGLILFKEYQTFNLVRPRFGQVQVSHSRLRGFV